MIELFKVQDLIMEGPKDIGNGKAGKSRILIRTTHSSNNLL